VWTKNRKHGEEIARRINAGTVMVNDVLSCFGISEAPHGGSKASGIGRTHGRFGMEEMVRIKYVDSDMMPGMKKVWWYGYGDSFARQMEGFVDLLFTRSLATKITGVLKSVRVVKRKGQL
jgi:succinate-semialdehyde dehydrogenase/glutarate-semialdehyde dehydrogenase